MRCDVVIKTWYNDLCWVSYCLRFLEKNWQEPDSNIIVLAEGRCYEVIRTWGFSSRVRYFYHDQWPDGNQFQGYLTLLVDHFSDADLFVFIDSDTMLFEPLKASDLMENGKPVLYYLPYDGTTVAEKMWGPIMERWLGVKPRADYMQRFPFPYWADSIRAVRRLITSKTSMGLAESLYSAVPYSPQNFLRHPFKFCEHNVIAFYCALHEPDKYVFRHVNEISSWPARQYHSWSDWSLETQAGLDTILREGYEPGRLAPRVTKEGWTVLADDVRDGHSSLVERFGKIDVDVGNLPTHDFIRPYLKPGSIVIDVGAHIGNFTIPMMRAIGPEGIVVAYEPHPSIFKCLQANVAKEEFDNPTGAAQCRMIQSAVGAEPGEAAFYCNPLNFASNTLMEGILSGPATVPVKVSSLDQDIDCDHREISFIKIDVEGGEWNVLRGAEALLKRFHPVIFMETSETFMTNEAGLFDYVRSLGYTRLVPYPQEWVDQGHHAHDTLVLP